MSQLIHTCYRIGDIDRSVRFYEALGFEEVGRMPIRDEAVNVFIDGVSLKSNVNQGGIVGLTVLPGVGGS